MQQRARQQQRGACGRVRGAGKSQARDQVKGEPRKSKEKGLLLARSRSADVDSAASCAAQRGDGSSLNQPTGNRLGTHTLAHTHAVAEPLQLWQPRSFSCFSCGIQAEACAASAQGEIGFLLLQLFVEAGGRKLRLPRLVILLGGSSDRCLCCAACVGIFPK